MRFQRWILFQFRRFLRRTFFSFFINVALLRAIWISVVSSSVGCIGRCQYWVYLSRFISVEKLLKFATEILLGFIRFSLLFFISLLGL